MPSAKSFHPPSSIALCAYCTPDVRGIVLRCDAIIDALRSHLSSGVVSASASLGVSTSGERREQTISLDDPTQSASLFADLAHDDAFDSLFIGCVEPRFARRTGTKQEAWCMHVANEGFTGSDRVPQPLVCISMRDTDLRELGASRSGDFLRTLAALLFDHESVDSGLIDIGAAEEIQAGTYYAFEGARIPYRWHRHVNHHQWCDLPIAERRECCRDVYWGTYVGPRIASRLDLETLKPIFESTMARDPECRPFMQCGQHGGVLFGLSGWPMTIHERIVVSHEGVAPYIHSSEGARAAKLRNALRSANAVL